MIIHVVQPGETINSIADYYEKSVERLLLENELVDPNNLVVGQTIVIVYPKQIYIIKDGDTLMGIAEAHGVTLIQLIQNNPYLSDREYIYPGETIVINYDEDKIMKVSTSGYAYPFVGIQTLRKTLPFLTYLSIFHYSVTAVGGLNDIDDVELIRLAKAYGVASIMIISTLKSDGTVDINAAHSILNNVDYQTQLIDNVLIKLKEKGYYGLNIDSQLIAPEDRDLYVAFVARLTNRLNEEGYEVVATITPSTFEIETGTILEGIDYAGLGQSSNEIMLLSYAWGHTYELPSVVIPFERILTYIDYAVTQIPPSKISIGITNIGYLFSLPYREGVSIVQSITEENAITLARDVGATIQYDEISQSAFFYYGRDNEYVVWFKDARSYVNNLNLVPVYGFPGIGIWNIMSYPSQMMLIINVLSEIEKVI
jgi:spore germination protein